MRDGSAPAAPAERFELRGTVGSGGAGVVSRAFDRVRGVEVALKRLRQNSALDVLRFKREFRALADIGHPNLVTLYELHTVGNDWFFTMELVEGATFIQHVRPHPTTTAAVEGEAASDEVTRTAVTPAVPLPPETGARRLRQRIIDARLDGARLDAALYQLVDGVHALHLAGKLHRDIKPSNVLVDAAGRVVLLDFGLVLELDASGIDLGHDLIAGTPNYMSPEQAANQPLTEASDWYSVGVMLYEALTGRRPFEGAPRDVLAAKQRLPPPPPHRLDPRVPEPLAQLCMALLSRDPAVRPGGQAILAALGRAPSPATLALAGATPAFVGRDAELAALRDALEESRGGRGVAVFVRGASGMGKSALLRQFLDEVGAAGALVLAGRCYERESVPYQALDTVVEGLAGYLARQEEAALAALLPDDLAALARLFPVLRRAPALAAPAAPLLQPPDPQELRRRAFRGLRQLLDRIAARTPVVLAIDDLHWGDADSAAFVADLIHHPEAPPILIVACHRSEEEVGNPVLSTVRGRRAVTQGGRRSTIRALTIGGLSERELGTLLASVGQGDDASAAALIRDCAGSPFFLTELARGRAAGDDASTGLQPLLQRHIDRLAGDARAVLQVCAVAARPLAIGLALRAAGLSREGAAISTLRNERLLRVGRDRDSQHLEPYHDRIREAVMRGLDAPTLRAHHLALADALEADGARDREALVTHWLEAGEPARAGRHAALAAATAEEALAFHRAADLYALAIAHGEPDSEARRDMQTRLGHALAFAGRLDEAAAAFGAAAEGASPEVALDLRRLEVEQLLRGGQSLRGMAGMDALLVAIGYRLPRSPRRVLGSLLGQTILMKLRGSQLREARVELTTELDRRIHVLWSLAIGMAFIDPAIGRLLQLWLLREALATGDKRYHALALSTTFGYLGSAGIKNRPRAEQLRDQGLALARELGDVTLEGWFEGCGGVVSYLYGRWREADQRLRLGQQILRDRCTGVRWSIDMLEVFHCANLWYLGDTAEMVRLVPLYLRDAQERGDRLAERCLRSWRSNAAWLVMDRPDEAAEQLAAAVVPRAPGEGFHVRHYFELMSAEVIALYRGDAGAHARVLAAWPDLEGSMMLRVESVAIESWFLRGRCALLAASAVPDSAAEPLLRDAERSARAIRRVGVAWGLPMAELLRAAIAHRRGDAARARTSLEAAIAGFDASDMSLFAAVCRHRLGALLGPDGAATAAAATAVMTRGQVANPTAMTAMLAPGW